jgi:hypothetical protein
MDIMKKVDTQPHLTQSQVSEQLSIPELTWNNGKQDKHPSAMSNCSARRKEIKSFYMQEDVIITLRMV